jgi:thiol-disulfide isomerase/thioredoxin
MNSVNLSHPLRALLVGFAAFALSLVLASVFHLYSPVFSVSLIIEILVLAVVAAKIADSRPWWHGLLAGLGLCVPGLILVLYVSRPRPNPGTWVVCGLTLLFTSGGAQSIALWRIRRRFASLLVFLGTIALIGMGRQIAHRVLSPAPIHVQVDKPLPDLALTTLDGTPIPASELQSYITVIDFWGTWCAPCIAELPSLDAIHTEYAGNPKVRFLLVNSERGGDNPEKIADFLKRRPISIFMALDPSQSYSKLDVTDLPLLLVIDQRGHIRFEDNGYLGNDQTKGRLRREINTLLATN